jgi:hypothetical protein
MFEAVADGEGIAPALSEIKQGKVVLPDLLR